MTAPHVGSARGGDGGGEEGAGPRGVSAARDVKLVPDIYLTLPGSSEAPRPEGFHGGQSEEHDPFLTRDDRKKRRRRRACLHPLTVYLETDTGHTCPLSVTS